MHIRLPYTLLQSLWESPSRVHTPAPFLSKESLWNCSEVHMCNYINNIRVINIPRANLWRMEGGIWSINSSPCSPWMDSSEIPSVVPWLVIWSWRIKSPVSSMMHPYIGTSSFLPLSPCPSFLYPRIIPVKYSHTCTFVPGFNFWNA